MGGEAAEDVERVVVVNELPRVLRSGGGAGAGY